MAEQTGRDNSPAIAVEDQEEAASTGDGFRPRQKTWKPKRNWPGPIQPKTVDFNFDIAFSSPNQLKPRYIK